MAIYHLSVNVISRATGASALASAAYRSASRLRDERLDRSHDFSNKSGVVHSEVMLPDGAPEEPSGRERLWNAVGAAEVRKDAQLAREVEFAIPREMLGEIEQVTPARMSVRLDGGRAVAFDLKDYAEVDHGYAAAIHKSQGVTVDQAHVLATPGLDRHAAYVALSRHRDGVQLHYGRDEFETMDALARTLSRERAKDMASDYARDAAEPDPSANRAPQPGRGMFAGFRPLSPAPEPAPAPMDGANRGRSLLIERHVKVVADILRMRGRELPVLPHQRLALEKAREALGRTQARALERAYVRDTALMGEAATGRTQRAIQILQLEAELKADPQVRADRFVERWQGLERRRNALYRAGDMSDMAKVTEQMGAMAKGLERDPQVDSLLRNRRRELGIGAEIGRSLSHDLSLYYGLGRGRGLGIGM